MKTTGAIPVAALERLVFGAMSGCALFWFGACLFVQTAGGVPDLWLPLAFALGLLLRPPPAPSPPAVDAPAPVAKPAPRWLLVVAAVALLAALAAVTYGAVATPSRHWDGAASFDAKVYWLTQAPTLQQPFFAEPAVFHHSPDYPLLLPLLTAALERWLGHDLGRLMMPLCYLQVCALIWCTLRRRRLEPRLALATVLAVGLTPALLGPGGGAVDSGYSELPLLLATTAMAAGLLLRSGQLLGLGAVLAIAAKPEGVLYVPIAALAAFVVGERRLMAAALAACAVALVTWLPVRRDLLHMTQDGAQTFVEVAAVLFAVAAVGGALFATDALALRTARPGRLRWALGLGAPAVAIACLPLLQSILPQHGAIGVYVQQAALVGERLTTLPAILGGGLQHAVLRMHFGATFVLPVLAAVALRRRGVTAATATPAALSAFVALGLAAVAAPFLLSPEPDLQHHLRSSMPRLLLHWLGPVWLLAASQTNALLAPGIDCAATPAARS